MNFLIKPEVLVKEVTKQVNDAAKQFKGKDRERFLRAFVHDWQSTAGRFGHDSTKSEDSAC